MSNTIFIHMKLDIYKKQKTPVFNVQCIILAHLFPGLTRKSTHIPFSAKRAKYFQDETNQTLIDVKFQAMVVLEKLMDLQRHFTLEVSCIQLPS